MDERRITPRPFLLGGGGISSVRRSPTPRSASRSAAASNIGMTENLSAKIEYDYLNFGTKNYSFTNLNYGAP